MSCEQREDPNGGSTRRAVTSFDVPDGPPSESYQSARKTTKSLPSRAAMVLQMLFDVGRLDNWTITWVWEMTPDACRAAKSPCWNRQYDT